MGTDDKISNKVDDLAGQFKEKTGIKLKIVAQGTGQALDTARCGDAEAEPG